MKFIILITFVLYASSCESIETSNAVSGGNSDQYEFPMGETSSVAYSDINSVWVD